MEEFNRRFLTKFVNQGFVRIVGFIVKVLLFKSYRFVGGADADRIIIFCVLA